ncbi:MAG: 1-phosphofructokinase [Chloroflexi bacterium AL-W]|nr:1-phosphofructokinase [Chloroflexi bacterium AL-N1]NOK69918.1 1-phosphofructokinase [Chloroflexi bacterium AL-N10]NOK73786.1 1-phosphofructokinase [Chloroflexi bacterium AL-N5]NOK85450.1 1-phosphofructokinase [Chloroflexi bacterium AL-W]NOK91651.1 1-phosphofructokinase [Chloroflexi bacterium AL-N15]
MMGEKASQHAQVEVVTVTLNPAIDQTVVIPHFAVGQVNRVEHTMVQPGGKGVNVATFLADYGHQVGVTGFLGRANDGTFENLFHEKRIRDQFVRIAGQTRTGIKITDPAQHQTTDINFPGQLPTALDVEKLFAQLMVFESS